MQKLLRVDGEGNFPKIDKGIRESGRPEFMTVIMWFVWLLRGDIRGSAKLTDSNAQREFVCWWLLFGCSEYPLVWSCGSRQIEIASELVTPLNLPRLLVYSVNTRPDLIARFSPDGALDVVGMLCWYRMSAPSQFATTIPLPKDLLQLTESPSRDEPWSRFGVSVPRMAIELRNSSSHLEKVWGSEEAAGQSHLANWYWTQGRRLLPLPSIHVPVNHEVGRKRSRSLTKIGVNLVGYPKAEFGIGEDVRMMSEAFECANIDHAIVDVPFGPSARRLDKQYDHRICLELPYPITIYCLTIFETADLFLRSGPELFKAKYRIGNWPWEMPSLPNVWHEAVDFVDEIWAASKFTFNSYVSSLGGTEVPAVRFMPPAVAVGVVRPTDWRQKYGMTNTFVFLAAFDPNSTFSRKNPMAAVKAFHMAFDPTDQSVGLLLRINGDPTPHDGWLELERALEGDNRIVCMTETLDRAEALFVTKTVDCVVSPHRAEGYGRNIAEAKQFGVPVLATGFSGNVDFITNDESIAWSYVPTSPGEYPHADGMWWAEPSILHLASLMRTIRFKNRRAVPDRQAQAAGQNSIRKAAAIYARRIHEIEQII